MNVNPKTGRYVDHDATEDHRTYSMFMHLVGLLALLDISGLLVFIAQLIMWNVRKGDSDFIDDHGREAVNFQISLFLLTVIGVIFTIVTFGIGAILTGPGWLLLIVLRVVGGIKGSSAANKGEIYRYPMCIRVLNG